MPAPVKGPLPPCAAASSPKLSGRRTGFCFVFLLFQWVMIFPCPTRRTLRRVPPAPEGLPGGVVPRACRTGVMTYPSRLASHALRLPDAPLRSRGSRRMASVPPMRSTQGRAFSCWRRNGTVTAPMPSAPIRHTPRQSCSQSWTPSFSLFTVRGHATVE